VPRAVRLRGIVEGFYGRPWSYDARRDVLSFVAPLGMNAYLYAPKDDPFHRARWREPYPAGEQDSLAALAAHLRSLGVRFGFAISPGLDIDYDARGDRDHLLAKLAPLLDAGVDWFVLALDDIPPSDGLAGRQAALATWLHDRVVDRSPGAALTVCPTEYVGTRPSPYLADLAAGMPDAVSLLWTGPTVCSPVITAADASSWAAAVAPHAVLLWDNYPVNDGSMTTRLHLGPYDGREADLADVLQGVLLNPMSQPHASLVALATAASFLSDPDAYDAAAAWEASIEMVGGASAPALRGLAEACADGPLRSPADLELRRLVDRLEQAADGPAWISAALDVCAPLRAARELPAAFADGDSGGLGAEVAPWAAAAAREAEAGLAAIRLLQGSRPVARSDTDGTGRAVGPDAELLLQAVFALMFSWSGARANAEVVFGPRFAIYPAVVQNDAGRPAVDSVMALIEDANAIDRLCRLALREYERWRVDGDETVRALVDGAERPVAADGSFDARGAMTLVRSGRLETCVRPGEDLPVRDRRLR
jgi:hyaluronoglucosaminidase